MKKTIVHIIDNFSRGGAETMLVTAIKQLSDFRNIVVVLNPANEFGNELKCDKFYCLNLTSPAFIPLAALRLRKIILSNNVDLVHSHLFWSTVVARLGVPKKIPLVTTIHAFVATSIEYSPWRMRLIEKITYKIRKSIIIAVAQGALFEYFAFIKIKPYKTYTLYTFVDTSVFNDARSRVSKGNTATFRIITVGNLKEQKNHLFLLEAFKELKDENISLDIYGDGFLRESLQKVIDKSQLKVTLKGKVSDIEDYINQYNIFVMSSSYEGFSLSVLEAMALGMPLMLSDITSFREQCCDTALYYDLSSTKDFVNKLLTLRNQPRQMETMGNAAKKRVLENYTLNKHIQQLRTIYAETLDDC
jgi:glycosyltransferase involved in cell wall biosynthesis